MVVVVAVAVAVSATMIPGFAYERMNINQSKIAEQKQPIKSTSNRSLLSRKFLGKSLSAFRTRGYNSLHHHPQPSSRQHAQQPAAN